MAAITLTNFSFDSLPTFSQTIHLSWRKRSDADVPSSYTSLPDATVDASGNIISPSPYIVGVPQTSIVIKAVDDCGSAGFQQLFIICEDVSVNGSLSPTCSSGYTLSSDGTYCYKIVTESATYIGGDSPINLCHVHDTAYSQYGTFLYKFNGYNVDGTYKVGYTPNITLTTTASGLGGSYSGTVWANPTSNTTDGRMNKLALWNCADLTYSATPVGFGFQINLPTSGIYYVGFGADNAASLKVNNNVVIDQNAANIGNQNCGGPTHIECAFKIWHVYPVNLNKGINNISISATNASSTNGAFACEIYKATEAQLAACTSASGTNGDPSLSDTNLNKYIIYSTKDVIDNTICDLCNYTCPTGYMLIKNGVTYTCQDFLTKSPS